MVTSYPRMRTCAKNISLQKLSPKCVQKKNLPGPVGPVSTGPLFGGKGMNIQYNHALNCLFRVYAIHLLPRRGRRVLTFALVAAKEPLPTLFKGPIIPRHAGFAFPERSFGESKPVLCSAQSHWFTGRFCTTTKVKMFCFATQIFSVSCFVSGVPPCT